MPSIKALLVETVWGWLIEKLNVDPPEILEKLKQRAQQH